MDNGIKEISDKLGQLQHHSRLDILYDKLERMEGSAWFRPESGGWGEGQDFLVERR